MIEINTAEGTVGAIPTGMGSRRFNGVDTVSLKKSQGFLISNEGKIRDWKIEKFIEREGVIYAVGPLLEGLKPWTPRSGGTRNLSLLASAIRALETEGYPLPGLYLPAIQILPDGSMFIAPPRLMTWIRENSPDEKLDHDWNRWIHPDLKGEDSWSFSLGILAWELLGETDPGREETGEERRERIRHEAFSSIAAIDGKLQPEIVRTIDNALCPGKGRRSNLKDWEDLIQRWIKNDIHKVIPEQQAEEIENKAEKVAERKDKQLRIRRWIRKSLWKFLLGAALLGTFLAILSAPLGKALETPITAGMSPSEVAATFYEGIDSLNSEMMDDCLAGKAGKTDRQQVDMIFVTNKVRQGYEGISDPPSAEDWIADGKPELPEGVWPWGITNLELDVISQTRIIARYEIWYPQQGTDISEASGERRVDTLELSEGRRNWEIVSIDRQVL